MLPPLQSSAANRCAREPDIVSMLVLYGWVHELRANPAGPARREAVACLEHMVENGLPFRVEKGQRCFDPAEAVNYCKWLGIEKGYPVWEERFVATERRLVLDQHADRARTLPDPLALPPKRFSVRIAREFNLDHLVPGEMVRLRLPAPLEDEAWSDSKVSPEASSGVEVEFSHHPGRLDAKLAVPAERRVTLSATMVATAHPTAGHAAPAETELYTRPNEGLVSITPRVAAVAENLAGSERDSWQTIRRFWDFLMDHVPLGIAHYDRLGEFPLDNILDTVWGDCQLMSALLVALARTRGIPARLVSGYVLYPASPFDHYWAEVFADGLWRPIDVMCGDLSVMGRDIAWRDRFFGRLDYRMKTQILPRLFNTNPALRLPPAWYILSRATEEGSERGFYDTATGRFVYRDRISVRPL
jgi:transglutaminase superfamily protein